MTNPTIILVNPQLSHNIGSTARAMSNFGLSNLRLVSPKKDWLNKEAICLAAGANDILDQVQIFNSVPQAIADLNLVLATTTRSRDLVKITTTPRDAIKNITSSHKEKLTGILFGCEKFGLTNEELSLADYIVHIPVNPNFSSLNLSQAVIIIAYELFLANNPIPKTNLKTKNSSFATKEDIYIFFKYLEQNLISSRFLKVKEKREIMIRNIRNIFLRINPTKQEIQTLHGIMNSLINFDANKKQN